MLYFQAVTILAAKLGRNKLATQRFIRDDFKGDWRAALKAHELTVPSEEVQKVETTMKIVPDDTPIDVGDGSDIDGSYMLDYWGCIGFIARRHQATISETRVLIVEKYDGDWIRCLRDTLNRLPEFKEKRTSNVERGCVG